MKKYSLIINFDLLLGGGLSIFGRQVVEVVKDNSIYSFPAETLGTVIYGENQTVTFGETAFDLENIDCIRVSESDQLDKTVIIEYNDNSVIKTIEGSLAPFITIETEGSHVKIIQSPEVNETNCGEITYILKGNLENGSMTLTGSYKTTIELQGVSLINPSGAVLDIQNSKRVAISSKNGTTNTLEDGASGSQKGCIYCKGHLEFKGKGTLNITGNKSHAINAKEYVELKNVSLNILGAIKDGINCNQYFLMESGEISISNTQNDGIQVSYKDDTEREAEDTGNIEINGGKLSISVTAEASEALKA